jgi:hypothetical protein
MKHSCKVKSSIMAEKFCRETFADDAWTITSDDQISFANEDDCVLFKLGYIDEKLDQLELMRILNRQRADLLKKLGPE